MFHSSQLGIDLEQKQKLIMVAPSNHVVGKFEAYFDVFYLLWVEYRLKTLKAYHWLSLVTNGLPLATILSVGHNGNLMFKVYCEALLYHWLP